MPKKKLDDMLKPPTNKANLSQNRDKQLNMPKGAEHGSGIGAGQGSK